MIPSSRRKWQRHASRALSVHAFWILPLLAAPGCSDTPQAPPRKTYPVTGEVMIAPGEPLNRGTIQFESTTDDLMTAIGEIGPDGRFSLTTYLDGVKLEGTLTGPSRVTIIPFAEDQSAMPIVLTKLYTVEAKENHFSIELDEPGSLRHRARGTQ